MPLGGYNILKRGNPEVVSLFWTQGVTFGHGFCILNPLCCGKKHRFSCPVEHKFWAGLWGAEHPVDTRLAPTASAEWTTWGWMFIIFIKSAAKLLQGITSIRSAAVFPQRITSIESTAQHSRQTANDPAGTCRSSPGRRWNLR